MTREEALDLVTKGRKAARRRRFLSWGLISFIVISIGALVAYESIGNARSLPPPSSNISASPGSGDWPMVQRDPAHSGFASNARNLPKGELKWRFVTNAPILSSPAVSVGRVYLSTGDRRILALDAESGDLIWQHNVQGPVDSSPAVAGNLVFVGLREGRVLALSKGAGEQQWQFPTGAPVYSSPAVDHGVVYVGSGDGKLYALDAVTGEERWSYQTGGRIISGPAAYLDVVAVTSQDGYLFIIDGATGQRRFDFRTALTTGSPTFRENRVYVADDGGVLRAIDWRQRELPLEKTARWLRTQLFLWGLVNTLPPRKGFIWSFRRPEASFVGTPVVTSDRVYIGSTSGTLFALDSSTGEEMWQFRSEAGITTSPSVVGHTVFIGDIEGHVYAIDALSGDLQWQFKAKASISSAPVFANEVLYVASLDGILYAIE